MPQLECYLRSSCESWCVCSRNYLLDRSARSELKNMVKNKKQIFAALLLLAVIVLYVKFEALQNEIVIQITDVRTISSRTVVFSESSVQVANSSTTYRLWTKSPDHQDGIYHLPDVQRNEHEIQPAKNIFFIVSTITRMGIANLTARQSCAIESAARSNPDWSVFVLFTPATLFSFYNSSHIIPLLVYPNVHLRRINVTTYAVGTPLENFFEKNSLKNSSYIVEHTSDILRLLTLYKYGGTYLDTDVVVMKSLNELPLNYLGSEGDGYIANGIINFQAKGYGHAVAESCLIDISANYNGSVWAANGPFLVTRIMRKFCNVTNVWDMTREKCGGQMTILPPDTFFQITYPHHTWYFEEEHAKEALEKVSGHVLTHLWNKLTHGIQLRTTSKVAYIVLAKSYCPNVIRNCKEYF
ncbi:lactosylceramide 4-alpha-galactosyltransferase-like [Ochlerotatus camptorhynchus]|uniref:lactosylceramide 4-alpha-galactosyltransferase-like n=1 Tax=Ochlerotatus camptorhynchus TaxID=644619 RepID=UPI0031DCD2DE